MDKLSKVLFINQTQISCSEIRFLYRVFQNDFLASQLTRKERFCELIKLTGDSHFFVYISTASDVEISKRQKLCNDDEANSFLHKYTRCCPKGKVSITRKSSRT